MLDHRRKGRAVGLETEQPVAQPYRGEDDEGRRHRVREKGHRRADRDIGAARQREQRDAKDLDRSEEHTSELQSLMRISYAVFCLKKKKINHEILYCEN